MHQQNFDEILVKHPEIRYFKTDQHKMSDAVSNYIRSVKLNYSELQQNLEKFNSAFSKIESLSEIEISRLLDLDSWTYTNKQREFLFSQLKNINESFPVPSFLSGKVKKGKYLDLRSETDNKIFLNKVEKFVSDVQKLSVQSKVEIDSEALLKVFLEPVHKSDNENNIDKALSEKIDTVWTVDVSRNAGLSIKDAMAYYMLRDAIKQNLVNKETIIVEGTSGNTGAGLAVFAAILGHKLILVIPSKQSQEKINRMQELGAHVIVTPTQVDADDPKSYYSVRDFVQKVANGWKAGQYDNLSNRQAHYEITGPELWKQTNGEITTLIATAGTCGTVSGIGKYLKEQNPAVKVIAVDTVGSILYLLHKGYSINEVAKYATGYTLQGFGEDIHPQNLDNSVIDHFIRVSDASGLALARYLPMMGFLQGQSSGAAYAGMLQAIEDGIVTKKDKVAIIFPDMGYVYRKDVFNDDWLAEKGFDLASF